MQSCLESRPITNLEFKLYPNPAYNHVILAANKELAGNPPIAISVYNSLGQLVQFESVDPARLLGGIQFNISSLSSGYYFMSIRSQKDQYTLRFIKLK